MPTVPNLCYEVVQCVPRHLFIRLQVNQLCQPCKDLNDPNDKEAIRAVLSLCSLNPSCWQKAANSQMISQSICIDHMKSLDNVFPITKAIAFVPVSKTVSVCAYSHTRLVVFSPADSQYQSQFDYKQTEADYLITSEEVTQRNSERIINYPYIRIQQNSLYQPDSACFTMRKSIGYFLSYRCSKILSTG